MANMITLTDKKRFYLDSPTKGFETERKTWRGIGLDGSLAGQVDCAHQNIKVVGIAISVIRVCECDCF